MHDYLYRSKCFDRFPLVLNENWRNNLKVVFLMQQVRKSVFYARFYGLFIHDEKIDAFLMSFLS